MKSITIAFSFIFLFVVVTAAAEAQSVNQGPISHTSNSRQLDAIKISSLKSNREKWLHYYNMVALDSVNHQNSPNNTDEKKMSEHYNSLAWYSILVNKLDHVEYYLKQSMKYDPLSKYPYANMPLLFLLQGHYNDAKKLYLKYKNQPFDSPQFTFKDEFLLDFKELAAVGITSKDITRITHLLQ